uniref:TRASH domain-containing protein n=1 Tax=Gasterosteus aculeatus aculeatus TaxID=481459 RepID=G3PGR1_GASAC
MDEGAGESSLPRTSSPSTVRPSSFSVGTTERGRVDGTACDDALDGLPVFGPEEDDEVLPIDSLEDFKVFLSTLPSDEGVLNQTEETEDSQEGDVGIWKDCHATRIQKSLSIQQLIMNTLLLFQRSEAAPMEDSNPAMSPTINIKDEPIDEGYDKALLPQSSIRQIKEELENQEVGVGVLLHTFIITAEMVISVCENRWFGSALPAAHTVQACGFQRTFPLLSTQVPAPVPAPPTTAIFIPGRGTVLQGMAPFPLRPPAPITSSMPPLIPAPPRPPLPSVPGSVRCSGCSKVLLKGQTAFQRKGSTQLFCSTLECLTYINSTCMEILQPRDTITIPGDENNTVFNFCGQFCLSVFRHKKKPIEPEVTHQGRLHRLCSDACFVTWRKMRHLAMNCCEGCGLYCSSSSGACQTLTIDRSQLNFCGPTCIGTYKQVFFCVAIVSFTIMERDQKGKVQLYCSSPCVERSRPPRHVLTGTSFPCCLCKVTAVPQYHLAMVDGTIRNFCSYDCSGITSQPDLINGTSVLKEPSIKEAPKPGPSAGASSVPPVPQGHPSSVPYQAHHLSHTSVPPLVPPYPTMSSPSVPGQAQARAPAGPPLKPAEVGLSDTSKLTCHQCSKRFNTKPLLFSHQGHISMFCSKTCCEQYKTQKKILIVCEFCKQEKVFFDTMNYNQQDLIFCGESCKQLFKQDLTSRNKDHPWRPCAYCYGISQKMLHSHYGGRLEEFCRPHCMSQFTVLYYGMGRCDTCRKQGYMAEKLQCLGSVRNFCNLPCLQQYCYLHFEASRHTSSNGTGTAPQTSHGKLCCCILGFNAVLFFLLYFSLVGSLPTSNVDGKNLDHASTQTDAMRVPMPRRRQMKNKSVLCRPFTMDQESMCQLPTPFDDSMTVSTSAGQDTVKVVVVPVPVPIFIPVPMNMYSQHTPVPMAIPVPPNMRLLPVEWSGSRTAQRSFAFPSIQGRRRTVTLSRSPVVTPAAPKLNHLYGVKAWRSWVQQQNKLPRQCEPQLSLHPMDIKEDVLQCNSAELSFALSHFIRDVRRPNGETYSPDSIFYLCLGIQQYLFMKGRIENIFTDELYSQFAARISGMLSLWKPRLLPGGTISDVVLPPPVWWSPTCGSASSWAPTPPIVLLNTLLFFCTKHFGFTTLAQHQSLSFTNFTRHSKPGKRAAKVDYLRFTLLLSITRPKKSPVSRKRKGGEAEDHELLENVANPLHCPVRLYEFYLSRCPESVKTRTDVFFLQPEQLVHTNSSHWYTSQPLDATTLQNMLTRISAVREVHQHLEQEAARHPPSVAPDNGGLQ